MKRLKEVGTPKDTDRVVVGLSPVLLKRGARRPAVIHLQHLLGLVSDGIFGPKTEKAVRRFQRSHGLSVDGIVGQKTATALWLDSRRRGRSWKWKLQVFEWISWVETGSHLDAFGFAEPDIGDGAGANYGCIQYNARGSMARLLQEAERPDLLDLYHRWPKDRPVPKIRRWMGSSDGIRAQLQDFRGVILHKATQNMAQLFHPTQILGVEPNASCLFADIVVQGGTTFSPYRTPHLDVMKPYFDEVLAPYLQQKPAAVWNQMTKLLDRYRGEEPQQVNLRVLKWLVGRRYNSDEGRLVAVAIYRGACSRKRYARRVIDRKLAIATGHGRVHGREVDMVADFGLVGANQMEV